MFQPLVAYGFELFPSSIPLVEPPPPASTNSVPAPTAAFPSCTQWASDPARRRPTRLRRLSSARCNDTNPAVAISRTADSVVVIRQTGVGRFYYKRAGLQNKLSVEIDDPAQTEATFVATNNGVQHSPSPTALIITQGSTVLSNEPMLEYWSA